jgi:metal-responsive CopG/Arc/MetJ family transcriptional regulator
METTTSAEITIRLEGDLLRAVDSIAQTSGLPSRHDAIEKILLRWYQAWRQHESDRDTEAYYKSLAPEEIEEDRLWARFASEQAIQRWNDQ